jgi:hypothetical protein
MVLFCVHNTKFVWIFPLYCRPLQSMDARDSEFDASALKVLGGDQGKAAILSLKLGRQGKDLQPSAVSGFTGLLKIT